VQADWALVCLRLITTFLSFISRALSLSSARPRVLTAQVLWHGHTAAAVLQKMDFNLAEGLRKK
jgi:hypothetical protein